ncbi:diacylglycerol O-acyltransferase 1-like [Pristis pectinata]|uniref:diacylglycerol O-acyltransferase 1-like n=1 Tax=Pristis pectinata TaxID=685728 RepID=UPI00223DEAB3|nr:diacylglycerol O-acyltransferase 1-like [Pristis pectinata]
MEDADKGTAIPGVSPKTKRKNTQKFSSVKIKPQTTERSKFYEDLVEEMRRKMCCHKTRESLLSSSSGFLNYRGILNWAVVVLILTHTHMVFENLITYGILVDPVQIIAFALSDPNTWPGSYLIIVSNIFILIALHTERSLSALAMSEKMGYTIQMINLGAVLFIPLFVLKVLTTSTAVGSAMVLTVHSIIFMKLYSYHEVNRWLREEWAPLGLKSAMKQPGITSCVFGNGENNGNRNNVDEVITYPDNLTVRDLYYFLLAPTLCYQMNFPRSAKIRIRFLLRRLFEMWVLPVTRNSMLPFVEMKLTIIIHQLLLIAIPNHFMWLIFFHGFFHSTLNFVAELMRFGDRRFYRDWWNSETLTYFWSNSNIIFHKWCMRHVYRPLVEKGYSKWEGQASVFILSALYHEYLLAAPLHMIRFWLFLGMMFQVPTAWILSKYLRGLYGNAIVWICIILGPPLIVHMYIHDYYVFQERKANV